MAASSVPLFWWILLILRSFFTSAGQMNIKPGEDITLPCRSAEGKSVIALEWSRTDLGSDSVFLYRDYRTDLRSQHPSFKNRVTLLDNQMKDGDVSLVLKNVTTSDNGTYECKVQIEGSTDTKLINTIILDFSPGGDNTKGEKDRSTEVIVGLVIPFAVIVAAAVSFLIYKKQIACFKKKTPDPPVNL